MRQPDRLSTFDSSAKALRPALINGPAQRSYRMKLAGHLSDQLEIFWKEEAGVSLVECVLIAFLILMVSMLLLLALDKDA